MRIIVDTREQKNSHILKYFAIHDIDYIEKKLDVADYQIESKTDIAIDRKRNLDELARNLMNRADHSRFWKEVRRAKEQGIKILAQQRKYILMFMRRKNVKQQTYIMGCLMALPRTKRI